jgi:capsule polysaccharide export protein KpsE/RkpR
MTKESKRVNAIIDMTLYDNVMQQGYATITEAIIKGLERLLEPVNTNIPESFNSSNPELVMSLNNRIESLEEQLKVKDKQLENKDIQIENLTNTMQSQAINIHDMLNQKQISETTEKKKPFWKFW